MADLLSSIASLLRADFAVEANAGFPTKQQIIEEFYGFRAWNTLARLGAVQFWS
jgi:hypothetical protein